MNNNQQSVIICSRCLGFAACRYDGNIINNEHLKNIKEQFNILPVCPEIRIGLPVPRLKIKLIKNAQGNKILQEKTGKDLTPKMESFIEKFMSKFLQNNSQLSPAGFILKSRSPSCGLEDCKLYHNFKDKEPVGRADGLFAAGIKEFFPQIPKINEKQLQKPDIRKKFIKKISG